MNELSKANAKVLFRVPKEDGGDYYLIENSATWEHADPTYAALFPADA